MIIERTGMAGCGCGCGSTGNCGCGVGQVSPDALLTNPWMLAVLAAIAYFLVKKGHVL